MNILLTGGGTGGHVYPAIALAEAFRRHDPGTRLLFVGSRAGMEARLAPAADIPFVGLAVRPPRSLGPARVVLSAAGLGLSLGQAAAVLARFRPDVVVATGGMAAVAPVVVGAAFNTPVLVLEGNAIPGRTNRLLARFARAVAVSSEAAAARLPAGRAEVTGLPIRREVVSGTREEGIRIFGLAPNRRTVLVIGGSQGAARLNRAVEEAVVGLAGRRDLQVLHQVGRGWDGARPRGARTDAFASGPEVPARAEGAAPDRSDPRGSGGLGYVRVPYIERVGAAYACADLVVSRCGANALAEITACGLPAILVPYPYAADDHQTLNAAPLVAAGAARLVRDAALTGATLTREIESLFESPGRLQAMAAAARSQGRPDAADRVVALVVRLADAATEGVRG